MQAISQDTIDTLEQDVAVEVYSNVFADWEINSFFEPTVTGPDSTDPELFPLEDIVLPRRPVISGLPKAITDQSRVVSHQSGNKMYRLVSKDSNYKYFHSNEVSDGTNAIGPLVFTLEYAESVTINKIVVGFEESFASPVDAELEIYVGGAWTSIGTFAPDPEGLITVYRQSNDTWTTTGFFDNPVAVDRVRVTVSAMNSPGVGLSLIQISPRYSLSLTDRVISTSTAVTGESVEMTNPIGTAQSSVASIEISNNDRLFDNENPSSPLYGMIDVNVIFEIFDVVVRSNGTSEGIPAGRYFADSWSESSDGTISVEAVDRSKFLQETENENSFYWNLSAEDIVRDMIERFGHPLYDIRYAASDQNRVIPYVFFKDGEMVWDSLNSLAKAEQAVFYFDEQDRFVWHSRDYLWQNTTPDFQLRDVMDGSNLPNLISANRQFQVGANRVGVGYTPLITARSMGEEVNNALWEESETLVLEASQLLADITSGSTYILVDSEDWQFFPTTGFVNVDGEYISYERSETAGRLDIVERGLYNSDISTHHKDPIDNFWSGFSLQRTSSTWLKRVGNSSYGRSSIKNSVVELSQSRSGWDGIMHYQGGSIGDSYTMYGCEIIFPMSTTSDGEPYYDGNGVAGMFIHHDGAGAGYYIEVLTSQLAHSVAVPKSEVRMFRMLPGGDYDWISPTNQHSDSPITYDIFPGARYRLEVFYSINNAGENVFVVYINGQAVLTVKDDYVNRRTGGYWGVWARDKSIVRFESAWAVNRSNKYTDIPLVMNTLRERASGGFISGFLEDQWTSYNRRYADIVFEDFGPWVHQGIRYEVDHDIVPALTTDLFISNDNDVFKVFHKRDAFSSDFAIVNKARQSTVVVGTDPRNDASMSLLVFGKPIIEGTAQRVERKDALAIKRRGREDYEIESLWIQTEERAERIADWMVTRWGSSNDIVEVEMFMFPALQVGDLVEINSPSTNMLPATHQYHVVGISKTIGGTNSMTTTLRRVR
ncbi:MAG: hypothetical protein LC650_00975 [Actinobacteria bacterium]|nr:hypothetical protein [Actinomycetota bacterium]